MSDDGRLRQMAREAIQGGRLPDRAPDRMWGGAALGARCSICGAPVRDGEIGYELEFALANGADSSNHVVHARCFQVLESVREKPRVPGGTTSLGKHSRE